MTDLQGSLVAIVTPMREDGALDLEAFRRLIDWHIREGTDGIVVVGTTGESPTVDLPMIVYNVPGRTVADMQTDTTIRLSEVPNIIGIKDATADLQRGAEL